MTTVVLTIRCPHDGTLDGKRAAALSVFKASLGCAGKDLLKVHDTYAEALIPLEERHIVDLLNADIRRLLREP